LLSRLKGLHLDYYEKQLQTRCLLSKVKSTQKPVKKKLHRDSRKFLGDDFMYIDKFIQLIRNNSSVFRLLVESSNHSLPHLDLLVETFAFSFFEDLMNPHNSEAELLIELDLKRGQH